MPGISPLLIARVYDHLNKKATWTAPAALYLAAFTTNPTADDGTGKVEPTTAAYSRIVIPTTSMGAANTSTGIATNTSELAFPQATANYPATVKGFGIYDALTAGNLLHWGPVPASPGPITVSSGQTLRVPVGTLVLSRQAA